MMKTNKRVLAMLMALVMLMSLLPVGALAEGGDPALPGHGEGGNQENPPETYHVTLVCDPEAGGTISITNSSLMTGGASAFAEGETVYLSIAANSGYSFNANNGLIVNGETVAVSVNPLGGGYSASFDMPGKATEVKASFTGNAGLPPVTAYAFSTSVSPEGAGCAGYTNENYNDISLNATVNKNYAFEGWYDEENELFSADPNYAFTLTRDLHLTARFYRTGYTVSVQAEPAEGGSVEASSLAITPSPSVNVLAGERATVKATPNEGFSFAEWTLNGQQVGTEAEYSFIPTGDTELVAVFEAIPTGSSVWWEFAAGTKTLTISDEANKGEGYRPFSLTEQLAAALNDEDLPWVNEYVQTVVILGAPAPASTANWFFGQNELTKIQNLAGLDTSSVTDMHNMFRGCKLLTSLDLSGFTMDQATDLSSMFFNCEALDTLDTSGWDTGSVEDMACMFYGCSGFTGLDLSHFKTGSVTTMDSMFEGCTGLTVLNIGKFNTSNVTDMTLMFAGCTDLASLDMSGWDTGKVEEMDHMFENCVGLTKLDLSAFSPASLNNTAKMFNGCTALETIYVDPNTDWLQIAFDPNMFNGCTALKGGQGTEYDAEHIDKEYARVDKRDDNEPGYFTAKQPPQPTTYTVTVTADPPAGGTVTGGGRVTAGQSTTVTATANSGYVFDGWYKGTTLVSPAVTYIYKPSGDVTLTAKFTPAPVSKIKTKLLVMPGLDVVDPSESAVFGFMISTEDDQSLPADTVQAAQLTFPPQATLDLDGEYNAGMVEVPASALSAGANTLSLSWAGDESYEGCSATVTFTVANKKSLKLVEYAATLGKPGEPYTISGRFLDEDDQPLADTEITIRTQQEPGSTSMLPWFVDTDKDGRFSYTVSQNLMYIHEGDTLNVAIFVEASITHLAFEKKDQLLFTSTPSTQYTVSVQADPDEGGTVTGGGVYAENESVTVKITDSVEGYVFDGWYKGDVCVSTDLSYSFNCTENVALIARFLEITNIRYSLSPSSVADVDGESFTIKVTLTSARDGSSLPDAEYARLTLRRDGRDVGHYSASEKAFTIAASELGVGEHTLRLEYPGSDEYLHRSSEVKVKVVKKKALRLVDFAPTSASLNTGYTITGRVLDENDLPVANKELIIFVPDDEGSSTGYSLDASTDGDGRFSVSVDRYLPTSEGKRTIYVICSADDSYKRMRASSDISFGNVSIYTVTFHIVNGAWNDNTTQKTVTLDKNSTIRATELPVPQPASGFGVGAWDVNPVDQTVDGDLSFTWSYFHYKIDYDTQGIGTAPAQTQSVNSGSSGNGSPDVEWYGSAAERTVQSGNDFYRVYDAQGLIWFTAPDDDSTAVKPDTPIGADTTLYCKWVEGKKVVDAVSLSVFPKAGDPIPQDHWYPGGEWGELSAQFVRANGTDYEIGAVNWDPDGDTTFKQGKTYELRVQVSTGDMESSRTFLKGHATVQLDGSSAITNPEVCYALSVDGAVSAEIDYVRPTESFVTIQYTVPAPTMSKPVNVTVTGNTASADYDGTEKSVSGFSFTAKDSDDGDVSGVTVTLKSAYAGAASIKKTDAGDYYMGLKAEYFEVTLPDGYTLGKLTVSDDGKLSIAPYKLVVEISGKQETKPFNNAEQRVEGFTVALQGTLPAPMTYTEADVDDNGTAVAKGTQPGDYPMGLDASKFTNKNKNFDVMFVVKQDGLLKIEPAQQPSTVTLTAADARKTYDGKPLTEPGFTADGLPDGFTAEVTMSAASTITNAGKQANVIDSYVIKNSAGEVKTDEFTVQTKDGELTVQPKPVTITVHSSVKRFGEADPVFTGTVTGLVDPDDLVTVSYVRTNSDEAVGDYPDVLDARYTDNKNYDVTVKKGDFKIAKAGQLYTVSVSASPTEGGTVSVPNGGTVAAGESVTVKATPNKDYVFVGWYKGTEFISYDNPCDYKPLDNTALTARFIRVISSFTLPVTAPVKGEAPQSSITATDQYTGTISWSPDDSPFAASTAYTATVELKAKAGHVFDIDAVAGVEGAGAVDCHVSSDGSGMTITAAFPRTADKTLTGITVAGGPDKTSYVHGDALETAGLVVKAQYDVGPEESITGFTVKYNKGDCLRYGDTEVTVEYGGKSCTLNGLSVGKKELTVSGLKFEDRAYSGDNVVKLLSAGTLEGVVAGDSVTLGSNGKPMLADPYVGDNKPVQNYSCSLSGPDADNYTLKQPSMSVNIFAAENLVDYLSTFEVGTSDVYSLLCLIVNVNLDGGTVSFSIADNETDAVLDGTTLKTGVLCGKVVLNVHVSAKDLNNDKVPEYKAWEKEKAVTVTVKGQGKEYSLSYAYDSSGGAPEDFVLENQWFYQQALGAANKKKSGDTVSFVTPTTTSVYKGQQKGIWSFEWTVKTSGGVTVPVANNSFTMPESNVTVTGKWSFTPNAGTKPSITTTALPNATTDSNYQATVEATGTMPIKWTVTGAFPGSVFADDAKTGGELPIEGNIHSGDAGDYTVKVRAENDAGFDEKTFTFKVTKVYKLQSSVTPAGSGTVTFKKNGAEVTRACAGDELTVSWTPEDGYVRDNLDLKANNNTVSVVPLDTGSPVTAWSFTMPAYDVMASAKFKRATEIVFKNGASDSCDVGSDYTLFFTLNDSASLLGQNYYDKLSITLDGKPYTGNLLFLLSEYALHLNDPPGSLSADDHTVEISFAGDDDYAPCSAKFTLTITDGSSTTQTISEIRVEGFEAPIAGEKAGDHLNLTVAPGCHYTILTKGWFDNSQLRSLRADEEFVAGVDYVCWVEVEADTGYRFDNNVEFYANGSQDLVNTSYSFLIGGYDNTHGWLELLPQKAVQQYAVSVTADPAAGGTVTGGGVVPAGQEITVTATPNKDYVFDGWYEGTVEKSMDASYKFTPVGNITLTAKFTPLSSVSYSVTGGADSTWTKDSGETLSVTVERSPVEASCFSHFTGVELEGVPLVRDTDYTASSGSTIVTLKAATLQKLSVGSHTVTVLFDDGKVSTGLTVKAASSGTGTNSGTGNAAKGPKTGDDNDPGVWFGLLALSGFGMLAAAEPFLRRKARKGKH